jgi:hypothetical protein
MLSQILARIRRTGLVDRQRWESAPEEDSTLVVTHAELSARHGTGALLLRILRDEDDLIVFHSQRFFGGSDIEAACHQLARPRSWRIRKLLKTKNVGRILCVPFYQADVRSALMAQAYTGAPLALYIMDDQNIHVARIPDSLIELLIQRANICFAVSPALCTAYEEKYGHRFWLVPPVVDPEYFVPAGQPFAQNSPPRGILVGNLWSSHTLGQFKETVRLAGLRIDWYGNAGKPFITLDVEALAKEGIFLHSQVPEPVLIESARRADFAVVPAGTLNSSDSHDWLARASLPSRIIFLMAIANVPIIVMGHPETAAARFVTSLGIGTVCEYSAPSFQKAVSMVTEKSASAQIRARAADLSPRFSSQGLSTWLWKSMAAGQPTTDQFQWLMNPENPR